MKIYRGQRRLFQENKNEYGRQIQLAPDLTMQTIVSDDELDYILTKKQLLENKKNDYRGYCHVTVNSDPLKPQTNLLKTHGSNFEWGYRDRRSENLAISIILDLMDDLDNLPEWANQTIKQNLQDDNYLDWIIGLFVQKLKVDLINNLPFEKWELHESHLNNILNQFVLTLDKNQ